MLNAISYPDDLDHLIQFAENKFPPTFRYFQSHPPKDSFPNHVFTLLYTLDGKDAGYAHLDRDVTSGRIFLGICVLPFAQERGIGTQLMKALLEYADAHGLTIFLTVDQSNIVARAMYEKYGFRSVEPSPILFKRNPYLPCP